jgi:radical SAM superfamily enzyme YgiQ (UPF0313 family)
VTVVRTLLVNPPFQRLKGINYVYVPLGLAYLAAALRDAGHEVAIYNAEVMEADEPVTPQTGHGAFLQQHDRYLATLTDPTAPLWQRIDRVIDGFAPEVLGLSVMTAKVGAAAMLSRRFKERRPDGLVIWGGPHPAVALADCERHAVDCCVIGEGEVTMTLLLEALAAGPPTAERLRDIAGLAYRDGAGHLVPTVPRPPVPDLDSLPVPARDLHVGDPGYDPLALGAMITARGCPFHCGFCDTPAFWGRRARFRAPAAVLAEIEAIKQAHGTREFFFWDDTFTVNRKRVLEFTRALVEQETDIIWRCTSRCDQVDDEMLAWMQRSGCINIDVGVESGSERTLREMEKGETLGQILDGIQRIMSHGINVNAYFMMGFPEETEEDLQATLALIRDLPVPRVYLSVFTPYPGTRLYESAERLGLLGDGPPAWERFSHQSPDNCFVSRVEPAVFRRYVEEAARLVDQKNRRLGNLARQVLARRHYLLRHPVEASRILGAYLRKLRS